ncbi:hydroxylamine reductase, partial [Thecamonas trahens ATCC 50062]
PPKVAAQQDLLVEQLKRIAINADAINKAGGSLPPEVDAFMLGGLFSTLTNVNFDSSRFADYIKHAGDLHEMTQNVALAAGATGTTKAVGVKAYDDEQLGLLASRYSVLARRDAVGDADLSSAIELGTYALKGMAAYADHAAKLGVTDDSVHAFIHSALAKIARVESGAESATMADMLQHVLDIGGKNVEVMAMLDSAHRTAFGTPTPRSVTTTPKEGKAILVSGHDLADLQALLEQTKDTGIRVYTHGEMLPAHGYPELAKYRHLAGHYGTAWQLQQLEFNLFPGAIVVTTNCLMPPRRKYANRLFTTNAVGFDGIQHVPSTDFTPRLIAPAPAMNVGYGHSAIVALAGTIKDLVEAGQISRFFVIGGCDGSESERSYFTKLAKLTPADSVILTAGCGKYRLNTLPLGELSETGLPRVLDLGQCNDSYGAVVVANTLKDAFGLDSINDLPLSISLSWLEQKAVAVLASLLHLGIRNIRIGPSLPAFVTPAVLDVLVSDFGLKPIGKPEDDIAAMMRGE